ncbi:MAG TPA: hypothetical protein VN441_02830 [Syntrophomonas sp.]|nr:hypothetical protein [Syntrophomonas sp.]
MAFRTEFDFKLPQGYVDKNGQIHRDGMMRLATAADAILPLRDIRVRQNPDYLTIVVTSHPQAGRLKDDRYGCYCKPVCPRFDLFTGILQKAQRVRIGPG